MTDIDLATGLPKLEEDQFWRVNDKDPNWYHFSYVAVELVEKTISQKRHKRKFLGMSFGWEPWKDVEGEQVLVSEVLWDPKQRVPNDYTGASVKVERLANGQFGGDFRAIRRDEVTPELILAAAERAIKRYELRKKSKKLFGDYPPKKLPESTDA